MNPITYFVQSYDTLEAFEHYWVVLNENFSEFTIYYWCTLALSTLCLFGGSLFCAMLDSIPTLRKYKLQPTKPPNVAMYLCCLKLAVFNHLLVHMGLLAISIPLFQYLEISVIAPLPKPSTIIWQFIVCMICEDFCTYWTHRFLHWKKIYKYIHKLHHEYQAPFGMTSIYTHPIEEFIIVSGMMAGPYLVCRHILSIWIWTSYRTFETLEAHSGYDFPFAPGHFIPILSGPARHDYHHDKFDGNYGSMFPFWDWICGTDYRNPIGLSILCLRYCVRMLERSSTFCHLSFSFMDIIASTIQKYDTLEALEPYWAVLNAHCSEYTIYFWCTCAVSTLNLFGGSLVCAILDCIPALRKYKIQPTKPPTVGMYLRCLKLAILNHLLVHMGLLVTNIPLFQYLDISVTLPLPKPSSVFMQLILCMICEDFMFYWVHRFLHWKKIYKYIHKVHHEYQAPFGLTSIYTHPFEETLVMAAMISGPLLFCRHILSFWVWMSYRILETIDAHSGYDFPISLHRVIPIISGAVRHDYHHEKFDCNFGSMFSFWDWFCGTDAVFRKIQWEKAVKGEESSLDIFDYFTMPKIKSV
ncbi:hypothetical protein THRCLA_06493 [Thraustotheca clavata]|uniref:Fatty acid hydroxylase domain-containing protein n=1 Tax=Thraustotheca clavata TaxID=74557 RepID=A0A1V9ZNE9_9STRA|nr:hypothetical protein THRCLA_06493 [Thraustotheca clavata]